VYSNTCNQIRYKKFCDGFLAELQVAQHYIKRNYRWVRHRQKIFGVEVDLVFENATEFVFVEVKKVSSVDFLGDRISKSQKARLKFVFERMLQTVQKDVLIHYVVVDGEGEILVFDDFL
jgi:Holliday junction resolvase-like predicted endonuclease